MRFLWSKTHAPTADATALEREREAARAAEEARRRRETAELQAALSRSKTTALRHEIAKNGFTELLQQAMRRA